MSFRCIQKKLAAPLMLTAGFVLNASLAVFAQNNTSTTGEDNSNCWSFPPLLFIGITVGIIIEKTRHRCACESQRVAQPVPEPVAEPIVVQPPGVVAMAESSVRSQAARQPLPVTAAVNPPDVALAVRP